MNGFSIEQKAKAYDEAIKRAKELLEIGVKDTRDKRVVLSFFPELAESKDEKIKRVIMNVIMKVNYSELDGLIPDTIRIWLEKQGEQKPTEWSEEDEKMFSRISDILWEGYKNSTGEMPTWDNIRKWCLSIKERIQPKREWSEKDKKHLNRAINILDASKTYTTSPDKYEDTINWLKSLKDKVCCEAKCTTTKEWREEDERDFDVIRGIIYNSCNAEDASRLIAWLKAIKDRVVPQPKQEWSEEDEARFESCIKVLQTSDRYDTIDAKWLKSLKDRYAFKPSEEQLNGLKEAIEFLGCTKTRREQLQSLYEQLKKLRVE